MVQVILKETILGLGKFGQVVDVKPGYARNFLVPSQKALPVTEENRTIIEGQRKELEAKEEVRKQEAMKLAQELAKKDFTISAVTSDGTRLYGSIGVSEVQKLLADQGYDKIEKRSINLIDGSIREVGAYRVLITYHADVQEELTVNVISDASGSAHEDATSDVSGESDQD